MRGQRTAHLILYSRRSHDENRVPMFFTKLEDPIIAANDAFCDTVRFSKDELVGHDAKPLADPDDFGTTEGVHGRVT
jgi:hypothetical protein